MDNAKKKRIKKYISWVCIALVVLLLAVMPLMAKSEVEEDGPAASIHSGTVTTGTVSTSLHGGGTLSVENAEDVTLPSGVKITEFLVKNGDVVTKGTPLASVDKVSVMTAIVEVKETMEYLQDEMESVRSEKVSSTISATAGGRVKQVFAEAGDSVQDVMLRDGALAVLSLDGLMAVEIERNMPLTTGDSVWVTFDDDTEVTGRVESNLDGVIIITVEDEGYDIGEAVTVTTEDGDKVGAGLLYVHNAWKATAFTGTISSVYAKEETSVYSGSTLFTLKDTDFTAEFEYLADQHRDYEELMQDLFQMYQDGAITAPCDGVISGVDEDSAFLLAGEKVAWDAVPLATTDEKGWTVMLLSAEEPAEPEGGSDDKEDGGEGGGTPEEGTTTQYTAVAAMVKEIGSNGLILKKSMTTGTATKTETVDAEGNTVTKWSYSEGLLNTEMMLSTEVLPLPDTSGYAVGDLLVFLYDSTTGEPLEIVKAGNVPVSDSGANIPGMGNFGDLSGMLGGLMGGGLSGFSGYSGSVTTQETFELFDLEGDVLMTVTPQDTVSLTITLDERDIAKVSVGQTAEVKVEALRGETFEAEVTEVSTSGTNNGGSSKFTVKLQLPYAENMLDGMSATAALPLYTKMDVLTIPVEALVEDGAQTVVYTALDEDTGKPVSPVAVTTGASDGVTAEILSGLESGDEYYYSYYDILELDTSAEAQRFSFG